MTIDNETQLAVYRPLAEVMDQWSNNAQAEDLHVVAVAIADVSRKYATALKRGRLYEALGLAVKLDDYASKLRQFTQKVVER